MRQIFTSPRLENVEAVARMLNEAGIETWISEARSYKGSRRREFSYKQSERGASEPGVWVVKAEDLTRARELMRDIGLLESTRPGPSSYLPSLPSQTPGNDPLRRAHRIRIVLLIALTLAVIVTMARACAPVVEDRSHIVPVFTSPP